MKKNKLIDKESIPYETMYKNYWLKNEGYLEQMVWKSEIDKMPTVELPVRHGYWIDVNYDGSLWRCSVCGKTQCCKSNYCADCGAKMDGE